MNTLKRTNRLALLGVALVIVGAAIALPRIAPLVDSRRYTDTIPTAPPLTAAPPASSTPAPVPTLTASPTVVPSDSAGSAATATAVAAAAADAPPVETPTAVATATPTATIWPGAEPVGVVIPSIGLDAPVVEIGLTYELVGGTRQAIWDVPDTRAAGWHNTSARLGVVGNAVLNGHNTSRGEVFRDLYRVEVGAAITVEGATGDLFVYRVAEKYILPEAGQPLEVRLENARYIQTTPDERLTLVTCHPYGSLANRLVLIAFPDEGDPQGNGAS